MSNLKAPAVTLRPMTDAEFEVFRVRTIEGYAAEIGPARGLSPEAALEGAKAETAKLLPDGQATVNQLLWIAVHHEADEPVGTLWISTERPIPFVYGIEVDENQRGKGYGRSIMLAGEEECRRRGYDRLDLNVFGLNRRAINLYESLGYTVTSQQMRKVL